MGQGLEHGVTPFLHIHQEPKAADDDILAGKKDIQIGEALSYFILHGHDAVQKDHPGMLNAPGRNHYLTEAQQIRKEIE